jgi:hypothetical protein
MITKDYKTLLIQRKSTIFLQLVIIALGISALALLLWEPQIEGVNAHATTLYEIYFDDPFLAYVYIGSIAFFVALYQAFKLLGYIRQNKVFSLNSVKALRTIKYCAVIIVAFLIGAGGYINIVERRVEDDIAGGVMVGLVMIFISVVVATAAAVLEKVLHDAVDIKSKNNLTVQGDGGSVTSY